MADQGCHSGRNFLLNIHLSAQGDGKFAEASHFSREYTRVNILDTGMGNKSAPSQQPTATTA
eukprot:12882049-Prorocentrum_lima.AAC.1